MCERRANREPPPKSFASSVHLDLTNVKLPTQNNDQPLMCTFAQVESRFARSKAQVAPIDDRNEGAESLDTAAATLAAADPKAPPTGRPSMDVDKDDLAHLSPMHKVSVLRSGPLGEGDKGVAELAVPNRFVPP